MSNNINSFDQILAQARTILSQCVVAANRAAFATVQIDALIAARPFGTVPIPLWGNFPYPSFPGAYTLNSVSGNNDLYTAPVGRKALIIDILVTNSTVGNIDFYPRIKSNGVYYSIGAAKTVDAGLIGINYGTGSVPVGPSILNPGETFAVSSNGVGLSIWLFLVEFDASCPIYRAWLTDFVVGDNIVYHVPTGKILYWGMGVSLDSGEIPNPVINAFHYFNTGSTKVIGGVNLVAEGGAPTAANLIIDGTSISANHGLSAFLPTGLRAGDSVIINTDSAATGQVAWFNYVQVNADGSP